MAINAAVRVEPADFLQHQVVRNDQTDRRQHLRGEHVETAGPLGRELEARQRVRGGNANSIVSTVAAPATMMLDIRFGRMLLAAEQHVAIVGERRLEDDVGG